MSIDIAWLSGAGFRIEDSREHVVFIDPWLDAPPGNPGHPISVADVRRADLVLITHGDPGHYGRGDGVRIARNNGCTFASSVPLCNYVLGEALLPETQVKALELDQPEQLGPARVMMFPAVHPPWTPPAGYPVPRDPNTGILLSIDGFTLLFAGDSVPDDRVYALAAEVMPPTLALLPIGSPAGSHGSLESTAKTAAEIAAMTSVRYVFPHYNHAADNPAVAMLREELKPVGIELIVAEPGERVRFHNGALASGKMAALLASSSPR